MAVSVTPGLRDRGSLWLVVSQSNQSVSSKFSERPCLKIEGRERPKKTPMLTSDLHKIKHLPIPGVGQRWGRERGERRSSQVQKDCPKYQFQTDLNRVQLLASPTGRDLRNVEK